MGKSLADYMDGAGSDAAGDDDNEDVEVEVKPRDVTSERLAYLAEKAGVKDPDALVKLVNAAVKACMAES